MLSILLVVYVAKRRSCTESMYLQREGNGEIMDYDMMKLLFGVSMQ